MWVEITQNLFLYLNRLFNLFKVLISFGEFEKKIYQKLPKVVVIFYAIMKFTGYKMLLKLHDFASIMEYFLSCSKGTHF